MDLALLFPSHLHAVMCSSFDADNKRSVGDAPKAHVHILAVLFLMLLLALSTSVEVARRVMPPWLRRLRATCGMRRYAHPWPLPMTVPA